MKMLRNSTASVTKDAFTMPPGDTSKIGHAAPHDSLLDRLTRSSRTRELLPSLPRISRAPSTLERSHCGDQSMNHIARNHINLHLNARCDAESRRKSLKFGEESEKTSTNRSATLTRAVFSKP